MFHTELPLLPKRSHALAKLLTAGFPFAPFKFRDDEGRTLALNTCRPDNHAISADLGNGQIIVSFKAVEIVGEQGDRLIRSDDLDAAPVVMSWTLDDCDGDTRAVMTLYDSRVWLFADGILACLARDFPLQAPAIEVERAALKELVQPDASHELLTTSIATESRENPIGNDGSRMDSERQAMALRDDLKGSLATGNVCAFVGAGLSVGAGLPSWYDLIAELAARIGNALPPREWASGDALIDVAQAYVNRQGAHALISHLKDRLDTTGKQPSAAHHALARLPISLVFTANFDNLLERAFRDAGKRVEVVVKDSSIPFMRRGPDTVNIVKLYGDLDQPDTIVLARQQYESYFLQRPQMVKLLETELDRSDTLYLGWSGSDPYFKLVFGELLSRFGQMMRPGYAVMFDVTDAQRDELARKQIRLVELPAGDRTAQLAAWLERLTLASTSPVIPSPISNGETTQLEVRFRGSRADATQALAAYKADWYLFIRQSDAVLFGIDRKAKGSITDMEMHELLPTLGRITCGRRWEGGCMLTVIMPKTHEERLMPLWETIRGRLAADGWLEEAQGSTVERPTDAANEVGRETGSTSWNRTVIRQLLTDAFNDEELTTLCYDHFMDVYEGFGSGMSKTDKVLRLLDYCIRREQVEALLAAVRKANPAQFAKRATELRME